MAVFKTAAFNRSATVPRLVQLYAKPTEGFVAGCHEMGGQARDGKGRLKGGCSHDWLPHSAA